jgi:ribosome-binding protein aMBF1 (putative translation factor)
MLDSKILTKIGKKVSEVREVRGISYTDIAFQLGVNRTTIQKIQNGQSVPTEDLVKVLKFLNLNAEISVLYNPIFQKK